MYADAWANASLGYVIDFLSACIVLTHKCLKIYSMFVSFTTLLIFLIYIAFVCVFIMNFSKDIIKHSLFNPVIAFLEIFTSVLTIACVLLICFVCLFVMLVCALQRNSALKLTLVLLILLLIYANVFLNNCSIHHDDIS